MKLSAMLTLACAVAAATSTWAQTPPPPYGPPITLDQARKVAAAAEDEARARHVTVTIAVVDSGGTLVYELRMDGATLVSAQTAPAKAKSAVMWQRPTSSWLKAVAGGNAAPLSLPDVIASKGGELIVLDGHIVGAVGVGGSIQNEGEIAERSAGALASGADAGAGRKPAPHTG